MTAVHGIKSGDGKCAVHMHEGAKEGDEKHFESDTYKGLKALAKELVYAHPWRDKVSEGLCSVLTQSQGSLA